MIERNLTISIGEKKFSCDFPNVGQLIDLESLKQSLTNNKYGVMASSGITNMYYALDLVDAISFYQICVPSVAKFYDIKNFASLSVDRIKELGLIEVYQEQIKPWFDKNLISMKEYNFQETLTDDQL